MNGIDAVVRINRALDMAWAYTFISAVLMINEDDANDEWSWNGTG